MKVLKKIKNIQKRVLDFDIQVVSKKDAPYTYALEPEMFTHKATIYGRGIKLYHGDYTEQFLRFDYVKMRGKFRPGGIYLFNIIDVDDKVYKSFYGKPSINQRLIIQYYFFWRNLRRSISKSIKSAKDVFTKHIFKIIILAFLTWFSLNGVKHLGNFFEKVNADEFFKNVGIEIIK